VCCSVEEEGPASLLDACEYEFLVALSPEQFNELKAQYAHNGSSS